MKLSPHRIEARDRRAAAVHEAGHLVMARHFHVVSDEDATYLFPRARIWRSATMDSLWEKTWLGECRGLDVRSLSEAQRRMFGIAGYVAEAMWRDEWFDVDTLPLDYDDLSDTDKRACGPLGEPLERAARRVEKLFDRNTGKLWPEVLRVARQLIVESRP